jgi:hypothetical protein
VAAFVAGISHKGGTVLGASRGGFDKDKIMEACEKKGSICLLSSLRHRPLTTEVIAFQASISCTLLVVMVRTEQPTFCTRRPRSGTRFGFGF